MRTLAAPVVLFLAAAAAAPVEPGAGSAFEPWLHNPRERTATALRELEAGRLAESLEAADLALRLAPDDATTHFNAGTLRLLAEAPGAVETLEEAARRAEGELLPIVHFNLGNAHLATGRPAAAIESYKETLRLDPHHEPAKFNLELALHEVDPPPTASEVPPSPDPAEGAGDDGSPGQEPGPGTEGEPSGGEPDAGDDGPTRTDEGDASRDFRDQPELSAQQAAAILDAVERLERRHLEEEAQEARREARGGRDW